MLFIFTVFLIVPVLAAKPNLIFMILDDMDSMLNATAVMPT